MTHDSHMQLQGTEDYSHRVNVGEARKFFVVYLAFALPAASVYAATIALIVATKTYHQFIHRLRLYLAIAGLAHAVAIALEVSPADISRNDNSTVVVKSGWDWACTLFGAFGQYCSIFQTLVTAWISVYVFTLVAFYEQLKRRRHEVVGLVVVIFAPLLLTWEPLIGASYGLTGTACWISDDYGRNSSLGFTLSIALSLVPNTILTLASILLLVLASVLLAWAASKRNGYLRKQNRKALKQVLPLMLYPAAYFITYLVFLVLIVSGASDDATDVIVVSLLQTCSLVLMTSLLLHEKFRVNCKGMFSSLCRRAGSQHVILVSKASVSETSDVRTNIQHSENEMLINRV
ncbi:hypothetical protein EMCRGX_G018400 [Ephydatia muelleri]|eukprot:Em0012g795a